MCTSHTVTATYQFVFVVVVDPVIKAKIPQIVFVRTAMEESKLVNIDRHRQAFAGVFEI